MQFSSQVSPALSLSPRIRQLILALTVAAVLISCGSSRASAHARLTSSTPGSGTALATMPAELTISFSEEIDLDFSAATLLSVLDEPIALGPFSTSDENLVLRIPVADPTTSPPGTYTLVWRVLSGKDGHVTTGTIAFSVGTGVAPVATAGGDGNRPPWWRIAIKWLQLCGLIVTVGGFAFPILITRGVVASSSGLASTLHSWIARGLLLVLVVAGYDLAISASGRSFLDPPAFSAFRDVIVGSEVGRSWLVVVAGAIAMAIVSQIATRTPSNNRCFQIIGLAVGIVALFAVSAGGHASATSTPLRSMAIDWVHLTAVTFWLGCLPFLWFSVRPTATNVLSDPNNRIAVFIGRFSKMGLLLMGAILSTGFLRAADQIDGTRSLIQSDYGRTLIAKHLLLLPILVAAAANLLVVVPRVNRATTTGVPAAISSARRSAAHFIAAEIVSASLLLIAAGALTQLTPAQGPLPVDVATRPSTVDKTLSAGDLEIWLLGKLTGASNDRFTITVTDMSGKAPENLQKVIIASSIEIDGETIGDRFDAQELTGSSGIYVFPALRLGLRGAWNIDVIVRRAGVEDVSTIFPIDTTSTGAQPPRLVDDAWRLPRVPFLAWFFGACAVMVLVAGIVAIRKLPGIEPFAVAIMLTMIALITTGFAVQGYRQTIPVTAGSKLVNPVPPDAGSIQRGSDLYTMVCLECHGPGGGGIDDNNPDHLHPGGTNLTDTRTTGQRDGDLFWSISSGIGGTDMPGFDPALSESERWDLVNYLRTLRAADAERAFDDAR